MAKLSDIFKYISHFRHEGHQVGRKVGDMLELLTYAGIARESDLESRLQVEPKLFGFSEAGHKVEFAILKEQKLDENGQPVAIRGGEINDPKVSLGFIECKKVGVEQTINQKFKRTFTKFANKQYAIPFGTRFDISFSPRGRKKFTCEVFFRDNKTIIVSDEASGSTEYKISPDSRFIFAYAENDDVIIFDNNESLRDHAASLDYCKILEITSITKAGINGLLNDCLGGPQTPEKAKQASFVALDVRKKRFGSFDKRLKEKDFISVLVMTEFAHWEQKSINMIKSCIDRNFYVPDSIIVEAFENFEKEFGADFYGKITKDNFATDPVVRKLSMDTVEKYKGKIFFDISSDAAFRISTDGNEIQFL